MAGSTLPASFRQAQRLTGANTRYGPEINTVKPVRTGQWFFAGNRIELNRTSFAPTNAQLSCISRIRVFTPSYAQTALRVCFANWWVNQTGISLPETDNSNSVTISGATIEYDGVFYPITFSGQTSITLTVGQTVWSDPVTVAIPANDSFYIRSIGTVTSGQLMPVGAIIYGTSGEGAEYTATPQLDKLTSGTIASTFVTFYNHAPVGVVGLGNNGSPVALVVGDSVAFSTNEETNGTTRDARSNRGYIPRGLDSAVGGRIPFGMFAIPGTRASNSSSLTAGQFRRRMEMLKALPNAPFTVILSEMGVNDFGVSWSAAHPIMQAWFAFLKFHFPDKKIIQTTVTPQASQANNANWTDLANQTVVSANQFPNGARHQFNAWLRGNPRGDLIDGVIDVAPIFMNAADPGKWKLHDFSTTLAADVASGAVVSLTAAPPVGSWIVIDPGQATPTMRHVISVTGSGPYSVTMQGNVARSHTAGTVVKAALTNDGTHPVAYAHILAAPLIEQAKITGLFS